MTAAGDVLRPEDLRFSAMPSITSGDVTSSATPFENIAVQLERLFSSPPPDLLNRLEELIVKQAFDYCNNNQVHTARLLGVSRNILRTLLKRVGLLEAEVGEVTETQ